MTTYKFQTSEFGISDNGIHLLRSGFNYRTITFEKIKGIRIEKGNEIHNWWLIFIIGTALTVVGVYMSIGAIKVLIGGNITPWHAKMGLLLLIPVVGGYFIYKSFQKGLALKIELVGGERDFFPLKEIIKNKELNEFKIYLKNNVGTGIRVSV